MIKILFAGSPEAASKTLEILFNNQNDSGFTIAGVLSNPPSAKGRHKELTPTPVAEFAINHNLMLFTPEHLDGTARNEIEKAGADLLVSFAYGHFFGPKFMSLFKMGGINLHPSLLPKYRGCTPVPAAILNRDKQTAVTIQTISQKMDEGNILEQQIVDLNGTETGESLLNKSAEIGAELICKLLKNINNDGKVPEGVSQKGDSSYTMIIKKEDGRIDWNCSNLEIEAKIRAYYPDPGAWTMENDLMLRIHAAKIVEIDPSQYKDEPTGKVVLFSKTDGIIVKTGNGFLGLLMLQRQGKKSMNHKDFINGARDFTGTVLK